MMKEKLKSRPKRIFINFDFNISVPKENVATIERSASVQDGVSRSRHALLNGDFYKNNFVKIDFTEKNSLYT